MVGYRSKWQNCLIDVSEVYNGTLSEIEDSESGMRITRADVLSGYTRCPLG